MLGFVVFISVVFFRRGDVELKLRGIVCMHRFFCLVFGFSGSIVSNSIGTSWSGLAKSFPLSL